MAPSDSPESEANAFLRLGGILRTTVVCRGRFLVETFHLWKNLFKASRFRGQSHSSRRPMQWHQWLWRDLSHTFSDKKRLTTLRLLGHYPAMIEAAASNKTLVLILGAGASAEVNFPLGDKLRDEIATALRYRIEYGSQRDWKVGDDIIWNALNAIGRAQGTDNSELNELLVRARHIRDAMPLATSIDNFIDSHRHDARIATCGKLGIASCILNAERRSTLYVDPTNVNNTIDFPQTRETWLNIFFRSLVENCQSDDIETRLARVSVVTFNYDRSFEHFLHSALQIYYRKKPEWASNALRSLAVHHPYGTVGPLPWMNQTGAIGYGAEIHHTVLIGAAKKILTFSEGTDADESSIEKVRRDVAEAERLAFLGFAYHPLNMEVLFGGNRESAQEPRHRKVLGTAFGVSASDVDSIKRDYASRSKRRHDSVTLSEVKCVQLLAENQRSLSLVG